MYSFYDFFAIMILKFPMIPDPSGIFLNRNEEFYPCHLPAFQSKNGIVAVVDSKASRVENGQSYEDVHRNPEKLFVFQNGIATTFGANQILVQNPFEFSSKVIAIEDLFMNICI